MQGGEGKEMDEGGALGARAGASSVGGVGEESKSNDLGREEAGKTKG